MFITDLTVPGFYLLQAIESSEYDYISIEDLIEAPIAYKETLRIERGI